MKRRNKKSQPGEQAYDVVYKGSTNQPIGVAGFNFPGGNYTVTMPGADDSQSHEVEVEVLQTPTAAVAHVILHRGGTGDSRTFHGLGDSKRHPDDENDPAFGYDLALARAFKDVATKLGKNRAAV